ncbi:MAG: hypothetical protein RLZZ292_1979 [Bacteroidota bacterium]|jgi:hypothetical protein
MQKILLFFFCFWGTIGCLTAQKIKPFSVRLNPVKDSEFGHQISPMDTALFISAMNTYRTKTNKKRLGSTIYTVSKRGKEIKNRFTWWLQSAVVNSAIITEDRIFLYGANGPDSLSEYNNPFVIVEFNHNLDSLNTLYFKGNGNHYDYACSITQYDKDKLLLLTIEDWTFEYTLTLIDFKGNEIWKKKVAEKGTLSNNNANLTIDTDKNILVVFYGVKKGEPDERPFLVKMDKNGNRLFQVEYPEYEGFPGLGEINVLDSTSYLIQYRGDFIKTYGGDTLDMPLIFSALDKKDGTIQWKRYFFDMYSGIRRELNDMFIAQNRDIIVMGNSDYPSKKPKQGGWIMRLDPKGNLKWERNVRDEYALSSAKALWAGQIIAGYEDPSNSMIYATGSYMDTFPNYIPFINNNNVWLIALDSMGCFEPNCTGNATWLSATKEEEHSFLLTRTNPFRLFPNPVSDKINVLSLEGFNTTSTFLYQIYNAQGQCVERGQTEASRDRLEITPPPLLSGIYRLVLSNNKNILCSLPFIKI